MTPKGPDFVKITYFAMDLVVLFIRESSSSLFTVQCSGRHEGISYVTLNFSEVWPKKKSLAKFVSGPNYN